jgi:hypothetical protein
VIVAPIAGDGPGRQVIQLLDPQIGRPPEGEKPDHPPTRRLDVL